MRKRWSEPEDEPQGEDAPEESQSERRGAFFRNPFKLSLGRTRQLFGRMNETLEAADDITDDLWDDLEETLDHQRCRRRDDRAIARHLARACPGRESHAWLAVA